MRYQLLLFLYTHHTTIFEFARKAGVHRKCLYRFIYEEGTGITLRIAEKVKVAMEEWEEANPKPKPKTERSKDHGKERRV